MDADEKMKVYNEGFKEGMKHQKPSTETERRLSLLEDAMKEISHTLHKMSTTMVELKKDIQLNAKLESRINEIAKAIETKMKKMDNDIWTLKAWKYGLGILFTVGTIIFAYILTLIDDNLKFKMKETALQVVQQELQKYEVKR